MNYYRRYVGDYLKKTSRLSILEHGAYCVMLDYYYAEERPIPPDLDEVYRLTRAMMPEERRAVDKVLFTYFEKREDGYHNARADDEIATAQKAIKLMSEAGKQGAEKRWGTHRVEHGVVDDRVGNGVADGVQDRTTNHQPPTSIPQPPETTTTRPKPAAPSCPHHEIIDLYHEILPMGRQVRKGLWNGSRATHLVARWREDPERQNTLWWGKFFTHIAESPFLTGKVAPRHGGKPFEIDLEWIITHSNFVKIIEGKYDA